MEIHFCDLCNESVPQADLEQGRASVHKGRIVCEACNRAMSHELSGGRATPGPAPGPVASPPARAAGGVGRPALWVAALAMASTAAAIWFTDRRLAASEATAAELARELGRTREAAERAASQGAQLDQGLSDLRERVERQRVAEAQMLAGLDLLRAEGERGDQALRGSIEELRGAVESRAGEREATDARIAELGTRITRLDLDQALVVERLGAVEARAEGPVPAQAGAPGGVEAGPPAAPSEPAAPAWTPHVADLENPNAGRRWEAVDALGAARDPAVVPHVLPRLKDEDVFVRMAAARVLGDLVAPAAVGALIDALEDGEAAVREAALGALRRITAKDLRFDPLAGEAERAKRVKAWREWWAKEQEAAGSGG